MAKDELGHRRLCPWRMAQEVESGRPRKPAERLRRWASVPLGEWNVKTKGRAVAEPPPDANRQ